MTFKKCNRIVYYDTSAVSGTSLRSGAKLAVPENVS